MISNEATKSDQRIRPICIILGGGVALAHSGWIEENPNGSITVHDAQGKKTIYLKGEYREWHFDDANS